MRRAGQKDKATTRSKQRSFILNGRSFHQPRPLTTPQRTVDCGSLTLTDRDQRLVLYTAPPGSRSAESLALLNVLGTDTVNANGTL
jgi:hypothetical protein